MIYPVHNTLVLPAVRVWDVPQVVHSHITENITVNNAKFESSLEKLPVISNGGMAALNRKLFTFLACFMYFLLVL